MLKLTATTVVCGVLPGRCSQDGRGKIELCAVCLFYNWCAEKRKADLARGRLSATCQFGNRKFTSCFDVKVKMRI